MMVIPIVMGVLSIITKGLVWGLEDLKITGWVETIQTAALLRSVRILRRVLETCCHLDTSEKPPANVDLKKISQMSKIITGKSNSITVTYNFSRIFFKLLILYFLIIILLEKKKEKEKYHNNFSDSDCWKYIYIFFFFLLKTEKKIRVSAWLSLFCFLEAGESCCKSFFLSIFPIFSS